jgi:PAS domain S-box-containing protein
MAAEGFESDSSQTQFQWTPRRLDLPEPVGAVESRSDGIGRIRRLLGMLKKVERLCEQQLDSGQMYQQLCRMLVYHVGYDQAWVCLGSGPSHLEVVSAASRGSSEATSKRTVRLEVPADPPACVLDSWQLNASLERSCARQDCPFESAAEHQSAPATCLTAVLQNGQGPQGILAVRTGGIDGLQAEQRDLLQRIADCLVATAQAPGEAPHSTIKPAAAELVSVLPIGVWVVDRDFRIRTWNDAMARMTGLAGSDMIGEDLLLRFPFLGQQRLRETLQRVLETSRPLELRHLRFVHPLRPDRRRYVNLTVKPLPESAASMGCLVGTVEDVTAHVMSRTGEGLDTAMTQVMVEHSRDMVLRFDGAMRLCYANPAARSLADVPLSELIGSALEDLPYPRELLDALSEALPEAMQNGLERTLKVLCELDQARLALELTVQPHGVEDREDGVLCAIRDVSELLELREQNRQLEEQLRQAQKMELAGRFAGGIAHDFNNLLTPIIGYSQLAMRKLDEDAPARSDLDHIRRAAHRAQELTEQLLAFARKQVLDMRVLDPREEVRRSEKILRSMLGEQVEISREAGEDVGSVKADPTQLQQVLMNLALNAKDAMPHGGRVHFGVSEVRLRQGLSTVNGQIEPGTYVMLSVSDTGQGMDEATQERIFEPFFTTKPQGKGTGLGLSTVYGIVRQHDGHIRVQSRPGKGTTFRIYLPRRQQQPQSPEEPVRLDSAHGAGESVLVIEDEENVRKLTCEILSGHGYEVLEAETPEAALEICRERSGRIDVLLTDVIMPGMNGRELYERIHARWPKIGVLYMSGYTGSVIGEQGILAEGVHFLPKPFSVHALLEGMRGLLAS